MGLKTQGKTQTFRDNVRIYEENATNKRNIRRLGDINEEAVFTGFSVLGQWFPDGVQAG